MTAEIAIINRGAVTLATDSAVTLRVRGSEKIYNGADKLFELSERDPLGIMVYNNLEFMGISLEVAIKQFRTRIATGHYNSVADAAAAFFHYLQHDLVPEAELQMQHAKAILSPLLWSIKRAYERGAAREYERKRRKADYAAVFTKTVQERIKRLEGLEVSECFEKTPEAEIAAFYSDALGALSDDVFSELPLEDVHKELLRHVCVLSLQRDSYSDSLTGMVFAGFGEHDTFPSLIGYQIDGIIAGKLKKRETDRVITNRNEVSGEILPFAQREMVDRFLYGIDPEFERGIEAFLETVIDATGQTIVQSLPRMSRTRRETLNKAVGAGTAAALKMWRERMVPTVKNKFMREVQDMIYLMPKQELAVLAQELINLTSVKRKFSSGKESVGGPIDVALISRIDGFVWVRRKHYFEPSLNPRYFHRKYGPIQA